MSVKAFLILLVILVQSFYTSAQSYEDNYTQPERQTVSHPVNKAQTLRQEGIVIGCIGVVFITVGIVKNATEVRPQGIVVFSNGDAITVVGTLVGVTGACLFLAGVLPHPSRRHISFIAPRRNEVGLAYNF